MIKLKSIHLKNFCGYRDMMFNFCDADGNVKDLALLFASNGAGKSTCLDAIRMVCSAQQYEGRDNSLLFRKSTYSQDYDPDIDSYKTEYIKQKKDGKIIEGDTTTSISEDFDKVDIEMRVHAIFQTDEGDKEVILNGSGVEKNDLAKIRAKPYNGYCYYIDSDHLVNMNKFQIPGDNKEKFLELAEAIYGFKCELGKSVSAGGIDFFTDFIIHKYGDRVHFRRMSAGEKKIATLIRHLFDPDYKELDIILVDNVEMHVYMTRHALMIDKILEMFPDKQLIFTTHSAILVGCEPMGIKPYVYEEFLYDVDKLREEEFERIASAKS